MTRTRSTDSTCHRVNRRRGAGDEIKVGISFPASARESFFSSAVVADAPGNFTERSKTGLGVSSFSRANSRGADANGIAMLLDLLRVLRSHADDRGVLVLEDCGERVELVLSALEGLQLIERSGDHVLVPTTEQALRDVVLANLLECDDDERR